MPALVVVFCKIPISIPLKIEAGIHQYFVKRYSVLCWYRIPVYSPIFGQLIYYILEELVVRRLHFEYHSCAVMCSINILFVSTPQNVNFAH